MKIRPILYTEKTSSKNNIGLLAQDLEKINPDLVGYNQIYDTREIDLRKNPVRIEKYNFRHGELSGVHYENLVAWDILEIQKLIKDNQNKTKEIDILKSQVSDLKNLTEKICKYDEKICQ